MAKVIKKRLIKMFLRMVYRAGRVHGRLERRFGKR